MADDTRSEIVMKFLDKDGNSIFAESALEVDKNDKLMNASVDPDGNAFKAADYDSYSNFFDVKTFNFQVSLRPQDENIGTLSKPSEFVDPKRSPAAQDPFNRWRSASSTEYDKIRFPLEFDKFSFTRIIDGASPIFFDACCNQKSFKAAALVKRFTTRLNDREGTQSLGFLRIDFRDVLITEISWDDGDLVTESCEFICKAMRVKYRQQDFKGGLTDAPMAVWDQKKDNGSGSF